MFLELSDVRDENEISFSATHPHRGRRSGRCDNSEAARYVIYKGHFDDHVRAIPSASGATTGSGRA